MVTCRLCEKEIEKYNSELNRLVIDENHSLEICLGCVKKFSDWQGQMIAKLFPTKILKKRFSSKGVY